MNLKPLIITLLLFFQNFTQIEDRLTQNATYVLNKAGKFMTAMVLNCTFLWLIYTLSHYITYRSKSFSTMNQPSEFLLRSVVDGNQEAFAELYNYYRTPALKFCVALLKDQEEAENTLHEVFIKIWEKRAHIKPDLNFNSYLFTCLRNFIFDHFKRMVKDQRLRELYLDRMEYSTGPDEAVRSDEQDQFVHNVIARLSE